jgi:hypothetical protein
VALSMLSESPIRVFVSWSPIAKAFPPQTYDRQNCMSNNVSGWLTHMQRLECHVGAFRFAFLPLPGFVAP